MRLREGVISVDWIDDDKGLARLVASFGSEIGVDTEFVRTNTFFAKIGLVQVFSNSRVSLIDPQKVKNWIPFIDALVSKKLTKIMHASQEDLEIFRDMFGIIPKNIFDCQLANAFLDGDFSVSYSGLVSKRTGVTLEKSETRSDWLGRPLTVNQEKYAAEDVLYLLDLFSSLQEELRITNKLGWFIEEMAQREKPEEFSPKNYYLRLKGTSNLTDRKLSYLQAACQWREELARKLDLPRVRVASDSELLELSRGELLGFEEITAVIRSRVARNSIKVLQSKLDGYKLRTPKERPASPLISGDRKFLKKLQTFAHEKARTMSMAPELLGRKRDLEQCIRSFDENGHLSEIFLGWRKDIVGNDFSRMLSDHFGHAA